jgi:GTP-binding protein
MSQPKSRNCSRKGFEMSSKAKLPSLQLIKTAYTPEQLMGIKAPGIIFLGRSNAGKSSLINSLTQSDLANVSKAPGKTRSINYFKYGPHLFLVDLPGFGYARRPKSERDAWAALVEAFFDSAPPRLLSFLLVDSGRDLELEEENLLEALRERSYPVEILLTKADRLNQSERHRREKYIEGFIRERGWEIFLGCRFVSVKNGEGIESLRRSIYQYEKEN